MVNRQRGVTFVEVIAAAAILATLGSSLLGVQDRERVALHRSFDHLQAETAAQTVMETLRARRAPLKPGTTDLTELPAGMQGHVTLEAVRPGLFGVRVHIEGGQLTKALILETRIAAREDR